MATVNFVGEIIKSTLSKLYQLTLEDITLPFMLVGK